MFVLKLLAAAGGFGVGAVASGLAVRFLTRMLTARAVHWLPLRFVQLLGGTALGMAAWFFGFGWGGGGFGLGEGSGDRGQGADNRSQTEVRASDFEPRPKIEDRRSKIEIELLGGAKVHNERFYVLEGNPEACSLTDLQQRIRTRMEAVNQTPLKSIELVIYEDSVAQDHPAVQTLERWARQQNLAVTLTFPKREP